MRSRLTVAFCVPLVVTGCFHTAPVRPGADPTFGTFPSKVQTEWSSDGRRMWLLRPAVFQDAKQNTVWTAPVDAVIDGASIPRFFWTAIGGPYEGLYRDASVNHDFECCVKQRPWRQVHRMFYYGMRANGTDSSLASWMYWAVYHFGPRWRLPGDPTTLDADSPREALTEGDARAAQALFEAEPGLSLDEIEQLDARGIRARLSTLGIAADMRGVTEDRAIPFADKLPPCVEAGRP